MGERDSESAGRLDTRLSWLVVAECGWILSKTVLENHQSPLYLFGASGYMLTGWVQFDGSKTGTGDWFYLEESGEYEGACWHAKGDNGAMERWYVE